MKEPRPDELPSLADLESAAALVYRSMPPTPQYRWPVLEARVGTTVWVKHENHAPTGAFKVRGGLVYVDELCRNATKPPGVISATRGNHGQSVGFAARRFGIPAAVVVPTGNSVEKNAAIRALSVEVIEEGHDFQAAAEIADACRTPDAAALAIAKRGVERVVQVSDDEVESAMRALFADTHNTAEGGGAAALAGLVQEKDKMRGRKTAVGLSGGTLDSPLFSRILASV